MPSSKFFYITSPHICKTLLLLLQFVGPALQNTGHSANLSKPSLVCLWYSHDNLYFSVMALVLLLVQCPPRSAFIIMSLAHHLGIQVPSRRGTTPGMRLTQWRDQPWPETVSYGRWSNSWMKPWDKQIPSLDLGSQPFISNTENFSHRY